jgi:NAD(P)-dependent dehydrogenase (short-subunit alcohol dehydrogenase family)
LDNKGTLSRAKFNKPLRGQLIERVAHGTADEIADLMLFLASPRAAYITGTVVTIDGGISARGSIIKSRT